MRHITYSERCLAKSICLMKIKNLFYSNLNLVSFSSDIRKLSLIVFSWDDLTVVYTDSSGIDYSISSSDAFVFWILKLDWISDLFVPLATILR